MGVRHASGSRPVWEVVSILISMHIGNLSCCIPKFIGAEPLAKGKSGWMGLEGIQTSQNLAGTPLVAEGVGNFSCSAL